jgi:ketol-acid reductoisomerase
MSKITFGGHEETVVTREEFPLSKAKEVLSKETIAIIGYGVQAPAQALNLKDNGFKVIIGQRKGGKSWQTALSDGWKEGLDLFEIEEACKRGTIIANLLSDAGAIEAWPAMREHLSDGKALYFSHGFAVVYHDQTKIIPPKNVDVFLVAPKGSGKSVRRLFKEGKGINSSFAVHQDFTGKARDKALAFGIGIGSGYMFETTFEKEVTSDLFGERGVLLGAIAGIIEAQYEVLRENGHSPSEAFNETVEELTQSLIPLISEIGMDGMYASCSTTAQRGALDWLPKFREASKPVFKDLYKSVKSGNEARVTIEANSKADYREKLEVELTNMKNLEIWQAGTQVRKLRP